jgi:hypothetical protein
MKNHKHCGSRTQRFTPLTPKLSILKIYVTRKRINDNVKDFIHISQFLYQYLYVYAKDISGWWL